jgi:hypothetical protein
MILYHRTSSADAEAILKSGFKDHTATYLTGREFTGVWFSNRPWDINEGMTGDTVLRVSLRTVEKAVAAYEWVGDDGKNYREWLIPAEFINRRVASIKVIE